MEGRIVYTLPNTFLFLFIRFTRWLSPIGKWIIQSQEQSVSQARQWNQLQVYLWAGHEGKLACLFCFVGGNRSTWPQPRWTQGGNTNPGPSHWGPNTAPLGHRGHMFWDNFWWEATQSLGRKPKSEGSKLRLVNCFIISNSTDEIRFSWVDEAFDKWIATVAK